MASVDPAALVSEHRAVAEQGGLPCAACSRKHCAHSTCGQCGTPCGECLHPEALLSPPCDQCCCKIELLARLASRIVLPWYQGPGRNTSMKPKGSRPLVADVRSYAGPQGAEVIAKEMCSLISNGRVRPASEVI